MKIKTLHFKLLWRYSAVILSIVLIFMIFLYLIWGNTLQANASNELLADCDNITTVLDTQMDIMDEMSKRIVNSRDVVSLFTEDLYSYNAESLKNRGKFSQALFDIIKLSFDHMELNMFDICGRYVYVGMHSSFQKTDENLVESLLWGNECLNDYGKKSILPVGTPVLNSPEEPVISLCRAFATENPTKETAILEIQIHYPYISQIIENAIHNQNNLKKILVYDKEGTLIYPHGTSVSADFQEQIYKIIKNPSPDSSTELLFHGKGKDTVFFTYKTSALTDWTVFVSESERDLFAAFFQFRTLVALATVMILILTLLITNHIAAKISTPIQQLANATCALELNNLENFSIPACQDAFLELNTLYHSFEQMKNNLSTSLQEVVAAHTAVVDAQMLALQSQMNPHFLYNTLATISVLAEDAETEKIVDICDDFSLLLRYISSDSGKCVNLSQEILHTQSYINIIKIKYENRIQFHMNIEETLMELPVPKLIVQPLVENCIKYALNVEPPWHIYINTWKEDSCWRIQVRDNGLGFSEEFLTDFYSKLNRLLENNSLSELSISGLGLLNLYMRLYLRYKKDMFFELQNLPEGGACVTVGGTIISEMEAHK